MFQVKTISPLIVCICICWGLTPEFACIKYSSALPIAAPAPASSAVPSPSAGDSLSYLALGDSYTIGQSVAVSDRYPIQTVNLLRNAGVPCQDPAIIAVTGWTTADLLAATPATAPARPYSVVTLLIGVNNQYQGRSQSEYRDQFTTLLQRAILLAGSRTTHVIVISIPDYSVTPFARGHNTAYIAAQIDSFNGINKAIADSYKVAYVNVTAESRKAANDPSLIAGDGLHFSGKEYAIWASMLAPLMQGMGR